MDKDLHALLRDPDLSDTVKAALIPHMASARGSQGLGRLLNNGPVIAALASIMTLAISEGAKVYLAGEQAEQAEVLDSADKQHEQSLERLRFQFEVMQSALDDAKSPQERAETLLFLTEIELLDGLNSEALSRWGASESVPGLASAPPVGGTRLTGAQYRALLGEEIYGEDTGNLEPTREQIVRVLGCPGQRDDSYRVPLVKVPVGFDMTVAWDRRLTRDFVWAHEAVAPYFAAAFRAVAELEMSELLPFGGDYAPRRMRGLNSYSAHSWGIAFDVDPEGNRMGTDETTYTMHPSIVQAFKNAGFVWGGDYDRPDPMEFKVSAASSTEIAESGYRPQTTLADCPDAVR